MNVRTIVLVLGIFALLSTATGGYLQYHLQRHLRRLKGEEFPSRYSFRIVRKDGDIRWVEIDSGKVDWEGKPAALFCMTDITERKQMEDELRQSSERYMSLYSMMRLMCDNVPDLIWAKDLERRFLFVNRAVCEKLLCAKDTEEPVGKTDMFFAQRERSGHLDVPNWHTFGEICIDSDAVVMSIGSHGGSMSSAM